MRIEDHFSFSTELSQFLIKWTPRAIAIGIGGYYGLGIAYDIGLMAQIDQIAIPVIKHFVGYAGIGALMPAFQWSAAWSVRIVFGFSTGIFYDIGEKVFKACFCYLKENWQNYRPLKV